MTVYFLREGDLVKIGFSNDVKTRLKTLISGLHGEGSVLGVMPGDRSVERHFHQMFAADRRFGEWFLVTDRLLEVVATMTSKELPDKESMKPRDRLLLQEERYAEEAAYFINEFLRGLTADDETFRKLSQSTSIPADRLRGIYSGEICPITAGEYVLLRMMQDAAMGITPADIFAAKTEAIRWARDRAVANGTVSADEADAVYERMMRFADKDVFLANATETQGEAK